MVELKVKYFNEDLPKLKQDEKGDWIDLRVNSVYVCDNDEISIKRALKERKTEPWNEDGKVYYCAGDVVICRLGVAIELPENKKATILPRSSTFATWGLMLANSAGCIDQAYKGDNDEWVAVFGATRNGCIEWADRVVQFDVKDRDKFLFTEVEVLGHKDRNGYGSSGRR